MVLSRRKAMILYFSGTGNSQYVALQLAQRLQNQEIVSINSYMKQEAYITVEDKEPLIFVTPTYSWRIPSIVEEWIMKSTFHNDQAVYFVLTCGGSVGNAGAYAKRLCKQKNLNYCGLASVLMPENYLALFSTPSETKCHEIITQATPQIDKLAKLIQARKHFDEPSITIKDRINSGPLNPLFYRFLVCDRGFSVSKECVSCGNCVKRCPLNNITLNDGLPTWHGTCTHCMACIASCPTKAIEYRHKTKEKYHHDMMKEL